MLFNIDFFNEFKIILITGGAGFIGTNLIDYLYEIYNDSINIIVIDNLSSGNINNINKFINKKNFKFINHNIINNFSLNIKIWQIYHFACMASPPFYQNDPLGTLDTCYIGSKNILDLANINNCRILFTSTSEIYGDPLVKIQNENYWGNVNPCGLRSCYDEGKRVAETLFFNYHRNLGTNICVCRLFNTYGPNMRYDDGRVISNFIYKALKNEVIEIHGDGLQTRSFAYVSDTINGIFNLMNSKHIGPYNIGNTETFTINDLVQKISNILNKKLNLKYIEKRPDDPMQRIPDLTIARKDLNYNPKIDLLSGLKLTILHFQKIINSQT